MQIKERVRRAIGRGLELSNNISIAYRIVCQWCGMVNHAEVPVVAKEDSMTYDCTNCQKIVIEFHTHELDEGDKHGHQE